jgi:hypothetical protein
MLQASAVSEVELQRSAARYPLRAARRSRPLNTAARKRYRVAVDISVAPELPPNDGGLLRLTRSYAGRCYVHSRCHGASVCGVVLGSMASGLSGARRATHQESPRASFGKQA